MAIIPMTFKVEMTWGEYTVNLPLKEWQHHPLREEWNAIKPDHPLYGGSTTLTLFLKQEYNINIQHYGISMGEAVVGFESEQDYILWKLLQ